MSLFLSIGLWIGPKDELWGRECNSLESSDSLLLCSNDNGACGLLKTQSESEVNADTQELCYGMDYVLSDSLHGGLFSKSSSIHIIVLCVHYPLLFIPCPGLIFMSWGSVLFKPQHLGINAGHKIGGSGML